MSELVQMRQRIKAIETIAKVTHAMRLISMSAHSRMRNQQEPLDTYMQAVSTLFGKIQTVSPDWTNEIIQPVEPPKANPLIILVGSQKGLCGGFNTMLFHVFKRELKEQKFTTMNIIAVGKKAVDFIKETYPELLVAGLDELSSRKLTPIVLKIATVIMEAKKPYSSVVIFSNKLKTFFIQKPKISTIIPFAQKDEAKMGDETTEEYIWEFQPQEILDLLAHQYIEAQIRYLLFQSLLAEHSARFLSMDNSTRNARNLLDVKKIEYNKLRQATITKELTELVGSF